MSRDWASLVGSISIFTLIAGAAFAAIGLLWGMDWRIAFSAFVPGAALFLAAGFLSA